MPIELTYKQNDVDRAYSDAVEKIAKLRKRFSKTLAKYDEYKVSLEAIRSRFFGIAKALGVHDEIVDNLEEAATSVNLGVDESLDTGNGRLSLAQKRTLALRVCESLQPSELSKDTIRFTAFCNKFKDRALADNKIYIEVKSRLYFADENRPDSLVLPVEAFKTVQVTTKNKKQRKAVLVNVEIARKWLNDRC